MPAPKAGIIAKVGVSGALQPLCIYTGEHISVQKGQKLLLSEHKGNYCKPKKVSIFAPTIKQT